MMIVLSFSNVLVFNSAMVSYKNSTTQIQQTSHTATHTHTHTNIYTYTHTYTKTRHNNQQNIRFIADSAP